MHAHTMHFGWVVYIAFGCLAFQQIPMSMLAFARSVIYLAAFMAPSFVLVKSTAARVQKRAKSLSVQAETGPTAQPVPTGSLDEQRNSFSVQLMASRLDASASQSDADSPLASLVSLQDWQAHWKASERAGQVGSPTSVLDVAYVAPTNQSDGCKTAAIDAPPAAATAALLDGPMFRAVLHPTPFSQGILCEISSHAASNSLHAAEQHLPAPTPTLYVSTSSRHLGVRRSTSKGLTSLCSASGLSAGGMEAAPVPLPSPADSPLARRVTNERDENGYPTSQALVELLRQHSAASDTSTWEEPEEEQSAPWASLQLRSVSQQLPEDANSSVRAAPASSPPWLPLLESLRPVSLAASGSKLSSDSKTRNTEQCMHTAAGNAAEGVCQGESNMAFTELVALHRAFAGKGSLVSIDTGAGKQRDSGVAGEA